MTLRVLDLFCGAGGAAMGYHQAGFEVVGVDIIPQKRYPFEFHQADALTFPLDGFDLIHASPPCHEYSTGTQHRKNAGIVYPDLLPKTQELLRKSNLPYVIENVPGALKLLKSPIMLCGGMFGLGVMRHRYFESNLPLESPEHNCNGHLIDRDAVSVTRHGPPIRWYKKNPGATFNVKIWHDAMEIDWMNRNQLTQAIPPAYTRYIGNQILKILER
jgi:DNA (cytosine-5)-methyltransferase 1